MLLLILLFAGVLCEANVTKCILFSNMINMTSFLARVPNPVMWHGDVTINVTCQFRENESPYLMATTIRDYMLLANATGTANNSGNVLLDFVKFLSTGPDMREFNVYVCQFALNGIGEYFVESQDLVWGDQLKKIARIACSAVDRLAGWILGTKPAREPVISQGDPTKSLAARLLTSAVTVREWEKPNQQRYAEAVQNVSKTVMTRSAMVVGATNLAIRSFFDSSVPSIMETYRTTRDSSSRLLQLQSDRADNPAGDLIGNFTLTPLKALWEMVSLFSGDAEEYVITGPGMNDTGPLLSSIINQTETRRWSPNLYTNAEFWVPSTCPTSYLRGQNVYNINNFVACTLSRTAFFLGRLRHSRTAYWLGAYVPPNITLGQIGFWGAVDPVYYPQVEFRRDVGLYVGYPESDAAFIWSGHMCAPWTFKSITNAAFFFPLAITSRILLPIAEPFRWILSPLVFNASAPSVEEAFTGYQDDCVFFASLAFLAIYLVIFFYLFFWVIQWIVIAYRKLGIHILRVETKHAKLRDMKTALIKDAERVKEEKAALGIELKRLAELRQLIMAERTPQVNTSV